VAEVAAACRARGVIFHTDAVQALGRLPASLRDCPADLLSLSGHKLGAPPGIAALVVAADLPLEPLVPGHQEAGRRGGTPNVGLCEALALALALSQQHAEAEGKRLDALRTTFEQQVQRTIPEVFINGAQAPRAPGTSNLRFEGADGEALLIGLDLEGIAVASGAACASGSMKPSHVLTAMGLTAAQAQASLRFSYGRGTTEADLLKAAEALARLLPKHR
jgi:cysteine desulfurase